MFKLNFYSFLQESVFTVYFALFRIHKMKLPFLLLSFLLCLVSVTVLLVWLECSSEFTCRVSLATKPFLLRSCFFFFIVIIIKLSHCWILHLCLANNPLPLPNLPISLSL